MSILATAEIQQDLATIGAALREITVVVRAARHPGESRDGRQAETPGGQGSGIVWSADGLVVTNAHVATSDRLIVELANGRSAESRLVARDPRRDLAVLRVDP